MPWREPVTGGDDELAIDKIQSPDFVSGISGWIIRRDGTTEFYEIIARGSIVVGPNGMPQVVIDQNATSGFIRFPTNAPKENYLPTIVSATFNSGGVNEHEHLAIQGPSVDDATDRVEFLLSSQNDDSTSQANFNMRTIGASTTTILTADKNGIDLPTSGLHIKRGSIVAPALLNGWSNFGAGFENAGHIELPDGTGKLIGTITGGTTVSGTVLFTIPVSIRPAASHVFLVPSTGTNYAQVAIQSNGNVVIQSPTAGVTWLGLDNCHWPISGF